MLELIAFMGAPTLILIAEKPFGLVSKAIAFFDKTTANEKISWYKLFSYFMLVGFWAYAFMYAPQVFAENTNPLIAFYINGHWLTWLGLFAIVTRYGHFDIINGIYAAAYVYSIHEIVWIIFAGIHENDVAVIIHFWPALYVMAIFIITYFLAFRAIPRRKEVLVLVIVLIYDFLWLLGGYHAAVNNWLPNPKTQYFNDPIVHVVELWGWLFPILVSLI